METIGIIISIIVVYAIIYEIINNRRCEICDIHMNSKTKKFSVRINGKKKVVCSKCNNRIASQIHRERFNDYFKLHSEPTNNELQLLDRHISTQTKNAVWKRDEGVCVQCGSNEKLEFDHIIPVSKGGSNTSRNIQLLCEKCNRKKSSRIQ